MKTLQQSLIWMLLLGASTLWAQNQEVEFDIYTTSAAKASRYLLADEVALRDCPSAQCEQLTTLRIGTYVRLLAKSESPQTINDVCSRWYKIKMGPQIGWIWGGLISQKTMVSHADPEVKFVFGEAGVDGLSRKQYQIRAIKDGEELDRVLFRAYALAPSHVNLEINAADGSEILAIQREGDSTLVLNFENGYFSEREVYPSVAQTMAE